MERGEVGIMREKRKKGTRDKRVTVTGGGRGRGEKEKVWKVV